MVQWDAKDRRFGGTWYCVDRKRPMLRGYVHLLCLLTLPVWWWYLLRLCTTSLQWYSSLVLLLSSTALFGSSGLYHTQDWSLSQEMLMAKLDYIGISLQCAYSYTPAYLILLGFRVGGSFIFLMTVAVILISCLTFSSVPVSRGSITAIFLTLGMGNIVPITLMLPQLTETEAGSIFGMAFCYFLGALLYIKAWPNPWPGAFGFHEIFHTLVALAVLFTYTANILIVLRTPVQTSAAMM